MALETTKAEARRKTLGLQKYFQGRVLDIGCGPDPLAGADPYDLEQGDAQYLANIARDSYGTVYSSHTLEHMRDPGEALRNWWRVLQPGGYLIVMVPDEDLYEQGHWPSLHNTDHKVTFSLSKAKSWSPVTFNLLDLVSELPDHKLVRAEILDTGYDYNLAVGVDQTVRGAEASIEIIVQKVAKELEHKTNLRNIMLCPRCNRMELIVRGSLPEDKNKLEITCRACGVFGVVTLG